MARRRTKRYYRKRGKWSANIKTINNNDITATAGSFYGSNVLCTNPQQNDSSVSQQYTVKNVELTHQLEVGAGNQNNIESLTGYIMFLPQGYPITETLPNTHPEWIMAYRFYGSPETESTAYPTAFRNPLKVKTRLSRRLQTGDQIIYLIVGNNTSTNNITLTINGIVRWWTKAN